MVKADQEHLLLATKAPNDHVCFDVSAVTADQFMELIKDKSEFYRWGLLLSDLIVGDGSFNQDKDRLDNGKETMKVSITTKVILLTQVWCTPLWNKNTENVTV